MKPMQAALALPDQKAERSLGPNFRVLIEVPAIADPLHPRRGARSGPRFVVGSDSRPNRIPRRRLQTRRRLKREVKVAACLLLVFLPMAFHASWVWSGRLGRIAASSLTRTSRPDDEREGSGVGPVLARRVSRSVFEPAIVLMSIEPTQSGLKSDAEIPVVLPGYLLPEDSFEEIAHEGS